MAKDPSPLGKRGLVRLTQLALTLTQIQTLILDELNYGLFGSASFALTNDRQAVT
jgi:hypothetical protein